MPSNNIQKPNKSEILKTTISNITTEYKHIKYSFFKWLIDDQVINIQIGSKSMLKPIKTKPTPSTINIKSPHFVNPDNTSPKVVIWKYSN